MLPPHQIQLLRSLKKTAILILLLKWAARPLGEAQAAAILDSSRTTMRAQLNALCALGFARRTSFHTGFVLTEQGQGLFDLEADKFCPLPAVTEHNMNQSKIDSVTEAPKKAKIAPLEDPAPETVDPQIEAALRAAGIMLNPRTRRLARMPHINPEYIRAHQRHLYRTRGRRAPGLLVSILESAQPLPEAADLERRDYLGGKYAEFVEH